MITFDELVAFARDVEMHAEERGWDTDLPMLFLFGPPTENTIVVLAGAHPADAMRELPENCASGAILMFEGWGYPASLLTEYDSYESFEALMRRQPPSEHPQRVELRQVLALVSSGKAALIQRQRGHGPEVLENFDPESLGGSLPDAVRRLLVT